MCDSSDSDRQHLARMLDLQHAFDRHWMPEELQAILRHQMSAPVDFDLGGMNRRAARRVGMLAEARGLLIKSFGDLLQHPKPPVELLTMTKEFAKACLCHPDSALPHEILRLLYLVSIAVAMMRCRTRISELDDDALWNGLEWASRQDWLDDRTRQLLDECTQFLKTQRGGRK